MSTKLTISNKEDIATNWDTFSKLDKAEAQSYLDLVITQELRKVSESYAKDKADKDNAIAIAQKEVEKNSAAIKDFEAKLAAANQQLETIRVAQAAAASEAKFQARMAELDSEYDMDDEDRSCVAEDVKSLADDDMDFAKFKKKMATLMKEKSKAFKAAKVKAGKDDVEPSIDAAKADEDALAKKEKDAKDGKKDEDKESKDKDAVKAAIAALANLTGVDEEKWVAASINLTKKSDMKAEYSKAFAVEKVVKTKTVKKQESAK